MTTTPHEFVFFYEDDYGETKNDLITVKISGNDAQVFYWYRVTPDFEFRVSGETFVAKLKETIAEFQKKAKKPYKNHITLHDFIKKARLF